MPGPSLLKEVLQRFFSKPVTIQYPLESTDVEKDLRGKHYADLSKCIGCSLCAIECPADAIVMEKLPEDKRPKQNPRGLYPVINYGLCVFCYRCVTVCPVKAFITTDDYHLASPTKLNSRDITLKTLLEKKG